MGCISVYKRQGDLGPYSVLVDTIQFLPVDILHPVSPLDIHNPVSLVDIIDPVSPSWYYRSSFSQLKFSIQFLHFIFSIQLLQLIFSIQFLPVDAFDSQCWRLTVAQRYSQQICIHNTTHTYNVTVAPPNATSGNVASSSLARRNGVHGGLLSERHVQ